MRALHSEEIANPPQELAVVTDRPEGLKRWKALAARGRGTVFQAPEFVEAWLDAYGGVDRLAPVFVFVSARGEDVAGLPLVRLRKRGLWSIEILGRRECDYSAPLVAERAPPLDFAILWPRIVAALPPHDLLYLRHLPPAGMFGLPDLNGLPGRRQRATFCHPITMPDGKGDPAQTLLRAKPRSDLRRRWRRLAETGHLEFHICTGPEEAGAWFDRMVELRTRRFDALGRRDSLHDPRHAGFYRAMCVDDPGYAVMAGLTLDGEPIALALGLMRRDCYSGVINAFADGPWVVNAPTRLLLLEVLRWLARQRVRVFDMSVGEAHYKEVFGAKPRPVMDLWQARSLRGQAYLVALRLYCAGAQARYLVRQRRRRRAARRARATPTPTSTSGGASRPDPS